MIALPDLLHALKVEDDAPLAEHNLVQEYERAAVAYCERATGRYFGPEAARTEYFDGHGQREIWLANAPKAGTVAVTSDEVAVAVADYAIRGRVLRHDTAWGGYQYPTEVAVTYTAGYPPDAVDADIWAAPADVQQAVRMLTGHWYENRIPVALGTVAPEIKLTVDALLQNWRRL